MQRFCIIFGLLIIAKAGTFEKRHRLIFVIAAVRLPTGTRKRCFGSLCASAKFQGKKVGNWLGLYAFSLLDPNQSPIVVEVGGIEPPSESTLTGLSPGADGYCGSLPPCSHPRRQAVTPPVQVRVMMRGRVNSFPPHGRHINDAFPGLWPLRFRRPPLIRQQ